MTSITHFPIPIPEYARRGKENYFPPIFGCRCCPHTGKLHRHGFYTRNVISLDGCHQVYIARFKCPLCGTTYSQIPDFLIPYFQYSYHTIIYLLIALFLKKQSFSLILTKLRKRNSLSLSVQNLSFYRRRFIMSRFNIHLFFAGLLDSHFYQDMDSTQLSDSDFLRSLMLKIDRFSNLHGSFNHYYSQNMPFYFFSPSPGA